MSDEKVPTHVDLFSGIGGFALAARWAGFRTIAFCEIDKTACSVLKEHWPNVENFGDIRTADFSSVRGCDLLTGGFPCQPFSVAGKHRGEEDDRHLWPTMLDAIEFIRPTWIVGENVTGIANMVLDTILSNLEERGYQCAACAIPACAIDAPHKRERIFIIANTAINGRERLQRCATTQVSENRAPETLDAWHGSGSPFEDWQELMAESFVRRMDDGISSELDVRPRLRAYGNAIVPQVAFEILKGIHSLIVSTC